MSVSMLIDVGSLVMLFVCTVVLVIALVRIGSAVEHSQETLDAMHDMVNYITEMLELLADFDDEEASPSPDDPFAHLNTPLGIQPDADGQRRNTP